MTQVAGDPDVAAATPGTMDPARPARPTLAVHGHFYQPAREDPFTGIVTHDPSAAPAHDWNARVALEAYEPNAVLGNFGRIGWDLGPTMARWLREHRRTLHDAIVEQAVPEAIMAQGYHHAILPLASARDRRTEIRWAIRDLELRTGRRPTGLWLPETAADTLTLRICAEEGIRWTILAPWQAHPGADTRLPHRVELGDGLRLVVGFYDAGLSATVSFDATATSDADRFAAGQVGRRLAEVGIALIATDGELYGHHQPFRDLFLERLLSGAAAELGIQVLTPGAWLGSLDARDLPEAGIVERTSWSCHHGVARWSGECGCASDGRWKAPLRQAFDRIAGGIDAVTEARLASLDLDIWAARDRYVDVASGFRQATDWVRDELTRAGRRDDSGAIAALFVTLMQAHASRLAMYASCGWFWEDARRPETTQVLRFAAHAVRLVDGTCGSRLEAQLVDELAALRVADGTSGADLYAAALVSVGQAPFEGRGRGQSGGPSQRAQPNAGWNPSRS